MSTMFCNQWIIKRSSLISAATDIHDMAPLLTCCHIAVYNNNGLTTFAGSGIVILFEAQPQVNEVIELTYIAPVPPPDSPQAVGDCYSSLKIPLDYSQDPPDNSLQGMINLMGNDKDMYFTATNQVDNDISNHNKTEIHFDAHPEDTGIPSPPATEADLANLKNNWHQSFDQTRSSGGVTGIGWDEAEDILWGPWTFGSKGLPDDEWLIQLVKNVEVEFPGVKVSPPLGGDKDPKKLLRFKNELSYRIRESVNTRALNAAIFKITEIRRRIS